MIRFLFAVAAALALVKPAYAVDDWLEGMKFVDPTTQQWCCNHVDCERVKPGELTETPAGVIVNATGELWPWARVIFASPEDVWVRCRVLSTGKTRCLIAPPRGS